jgi:hypothetical protein
MDANRTSPFRAALSATKLKRTVLLSLLLAVFLTLFPFHARSETIVSTPEADTSRYQRIEDGIGFTGRIAGGPMRRTEEPAILRPFPSISPPILSKRRRC